MPKKYLVCVDGSEQAKYAFHTFITNMVHPGDIVIILSAIVHIPDVAVDTSIIDMTETRLKNEEKASDLVRNYAAEAMHIAPRVNVLARVVVGDDVREKIGDVADAEEVDAVIMGARGLGAIERIVLGSTSSYLINHGNRAVFVLRDPHAGRPH